MNAHLIFTIPESEIEFTAIRASGSGGQNVNKVSTAVHLRFDVCASSLPVEVKARLLAAHDSRISTDGVIIIKAQRHNTQEKNRVFEATLSGRGYLHYIRQWQRAGYRVKLIFLQLGSAEEAMARVAQRVRQGGHSIPEATIRRRFVAGRENFTRLYAPQVDAWALYDNAGTQPVLLDWSEKP